MILFELDIYIYISSSSWSVWPCVLFVLVVVVWWCCSVLSLSVSWFYSGILAKGCAWCGTDLWSTRVPLCHDRRPHRHSWHPAWSRPTFSEHGRVPHVGAGRTVYYMFLHRDSRPWRRTRATPGNIQARAGVRAGTCMRRFLFQVW